jgi:hypothetical protein
MVGDAGIEPRALATLRYWRELVEKTPIEQHGLGLDDLV